MGDVTDAGAPIRPPSPDRPALVVTLTGLEPGAPLHGAVRLADALDARRVPLTLLVGARPHPEVAAWSAARRRAGDLVLLHGDPSRRLPAHEAGLRLAGALRARDAAGLAVDGFAAPGWAVSTGVRQALAAAGVDLLVDDTGVHRLAGDGSRHASLTGPVIGADPGGRLRRVWPAAGPLRTPPAGLRHHTASAGELGPGARGHQGTVDALLAAVDRDLDAGAVPQRPATLPAPRRPDRARTRAGAAADPEHWSITA